MDELKKIYNELLDKYETAWARTMRGLPSDNKIHEAVMDIAPVIKKLEVYIESHN